MRLPLGPAADIAAAVRGVTGDVVVVIEPGRDPLALALTLAAVAPLAVERAPARVNAVLPALGAAAAAVTAAIAWLERARSTTGQVVEVSAPAGLARTAPAT